MLCFARPPAQTDSISYDASHVILHSLSFVPIRTLSCTALRDGASFGSQEEEKARGTAMEQAEASAEVSATDDACADAGVEEGWWWCVYVCV